MQSKDVSLDLPATNIVTVGDPADVGNAESKDVAFDLLLFAAALWAPTAQREAFLGDISERFELDCLKFGRNKAKVIMSRDIAASVFPIFLEILRFRTLKILKALGLYKIVVFFLR